jgi:protease-4
MFGGIKKLVGALGTVRKIAVGALLLGGVVYYQNQKQQMLERAKKSVYVLKVDFNKEQFEDVQPRAYFNMGVKGPGLTISDLDRALKIAAADKRVFGIIGDVSMTTSDLKFAKVQEVVEAFERFKFTDPSKPVIMFADTFGELFPANMAYSLATVANVICMQPSGMVSLGSLGAEIPFFRGLFDKLKIEPKFVKRSDYKTAPNSWTESTLTEAHKQQTIELLSSLNAQILGIIAKERGIGIEKTQQIFDGGPLYGNEAKEAGLIDEFTPNGPSTLLSLCATRLKERLTQMNVTPQQLRQVTLKEYLEDPIVRQTLKTVKTELDKDKQEVAVLYVNGMIVRGGDRRPGVASAQRICKQLEKLAANPEVKSVVLRINSPGGSSVASQAIYSSVVNCRTAGKKVYVSMGDVTASGGYLIAAAADKIFATGATLTGSIGAFGGKFLVKKFLHDILGVNIEEVQLTENSNSFSLMKDWDEKQEKQLNRLIDITYDEFKTVVAEGRKMTKEQVESLAQGRVYTGLQAMVHGLVDDFGSLSDVVRIAQQESSVRKVVEYPKKKTLWDMLRKKKVPNDVVADVAATSQLFEQVQLALIEANPVMRHVLEVYRKTDAKSEIDMSSDLDKIKFK